MLGSIAPTETYSRNIKNDDSRTNAYKSKSTAVWVPATADITTTATVYICNIFTEFFYQHMHISMCICANICKQKATEQFIILLEFTINSCNADLLLEPTKNSEMV